MAAAKAKHNPFSVDRVLQYRYELSDAGWRELLDRLRELRYRGAIVGAHGSGKTTLLEDLQDQLEASGVATRIHRLNTQRRSIVQTEMHRLFPPGETSSHVVLLDGAEQLGWLAWRRVAARSQQTGGGLVVTSHRTGRLPTLMHCQPDAELLARMLAHLLGQPLEELQPLAGELFLRHSGNIRDALREMYDRYAGIGL